MRKLLIALALVFMSALPAAALTLTPTGAIIDASWKEPTTNTDGTPLNDLASTRLSWRLCPSSGAACTSTYNATTPVPASSPTGGQNRTMQFTVPIAPGQEAIVEAFAIATDLSGNVSPESVHVTKRVDRLSPSAPE